MRLRLSSLLPCGLAPLVAELGTPRLLDYLARPMLVFEPVQPSTTPARWDLGPHRFRLLVGGRLPIGDHVIDVQRVAEDEATVAAEPTVWHDAGHSDLVKIWDHQVELRALHGMTRYTDVVEVHAGPLTLAAWLFALAFYAHRQRRLRRLVTAGFVYREFNR